ncbi:MAG: hypothetical protein H6628_01495 [Calditrichae bacterium]|nr:hypothetical protein [Calditrichia bacterium]
MRIIWFLILSGLLAQGLLAQDIEGSQDHPVISRYPGSVIQWYMVDNYRLPPAARAGNRLPAYR